MTYVDGDASGASDYRPKRRGGWLGSFFMFLVVVALGGVVLYLMSLINHQRFFIRAESGQLLVERGKLFPWGTQQYVPADPQLAAAYAPIPVPAGETPPPEQPFDNLVELNRHLFATLDGWARKAMEFGSPERFAEALAYSERAQSLPGLGFEQERELRHLRGDVLFIKGQRRLGDVVSALREAHETLLQARELGTSHEAEAARLLEMLSPRVQSLPKDPKQAVELLLGQSRPADIVTGDAPLTPEAPAAAGAVPHATVPPAVSPPVPVPPSVPAPAQTPKLPPTAGKTLPAPAPAAAPVQPK